MEYKEIMANDNAPLSFTFFDGLQLLLIGLKLGHVIDASWPAVMAPTIVALVAGFIVPPIVRVAAAIRFG